MEFTLLYQLNGFLNDVVTKKYDFFIVVDSRSIILLLIKILRNLNITYLIHIYF
jgi:hypothetical protein